MKDTKTDTQTCQLIKNSYRCGGGRSPAAILRCRSVAATMLGLNLFLRPKCRRIGGGAAAFAVVGNVGAAVFVVDIVGAAVFVVDIVGASVFAHDIVGAAVFAVGIVGAAVFAVGIIGAAVFAAVDDIVGTALDEF